MGRGLRAKQGDGRKPIPHAVTALISIALSLGIASVAHVGKAGPAGPAGKSATSVSSGVCWYFGPDSSGHNRFQISRPEAGDTCSKGTFVNLTVP